MLPELPVPSPEFHKLLLHVLEIAGTFAFAISGIRHAAGKNFDLFGGYVCGFAVAIGGGTLRDLMLGVTPFWMTDPMYVLCTAAALLFVFLFGRAMRRLQNTWFVFDTIGLALFTIVGLQKTLNYGHPFWVAIIMGSITGAAGGVIRDVLLNNVPVIFQRDIYAMASIAGGLLYWLLVVLGVSVPAAALWAFILVCLTRFLAVRYHISLPVLRNGAPEE